jgi:hypothetical protein
MLFRSVLLAAAFVTLATPATHAQTASLAEFFGFEGLEVVKIDKGAGPILAADINRDGLTDLVAVNNFKSRIEIHYQKKGAKPSDEVPTNLRVNEHPEHWRFRRETISVSHKVEALVATDYDGDGLTDLVYAGAPESIVFIRQKEAGAFEIKRTHRVKNLGATRDGLAIADVMGDTKPELLTLINGQIHVYPLTGDVLGASTDLDAGANIVAFMLDDFTGDGKTDILGVLPEDPAPLRLWPAGTDNNRTVIGPQLQFQMPALREVSDIRWPGVAAAGVAVIERASKRIVVSDFVTEPIEETGTREGSLRTYAWTDAKNRKRSTAAVDVDGDGLLDLVATDTEQNAVIVYRQIEGKGLQPGVAHPSIDEMDILVASNVDDDPFAEIFVLSEKASFVGRCDVGPEGVPYPQPLALPEGKTPVAMNLVKLEHGPHLAVVSKDGRSYQIDLMPLSGSDTTPHKIDLGSQSRAPETILAVDADQNGKTDLLLFTPEKPMTMLYAGDSGFKLMESKDMGQFGIVQAANARNTLVFDIDADAKPELCIADKNFVRAVRYVTAPPQGVSPGWQVVRQLNVDDSGSKLVSLAALSPRLAAGDRENGRLIIFEPSSDAANGWREAESVSISDFKFNSIEAGALGGDGKDNVLAVGDASFALVRLSGERLAMKELAAWRTDVERRVQHELAAGDVNGDGFVDLISLDAGEQMCEIFTFSASRKMIYATGFKVFESKLFSAGEPREFEPSQLIAADVTGDGANDLVLLAHDRVLLYPQMAKPAN